MDPAYEHIFDDLYNVQSDRNYPNRARIFEAGNFQSDEPVTTVRQTVDSANEQLEASQGLRLRSDARYFLLLNLSEMVVRPIQMRTGEPPFAGPSGDLDRMLRGDLDLLLSDAARRHAERQRSLGGGRRPDPEISGHSIIEALAANWTRLKLNSYRIWGER
jgi:hypothetical protein